MADAVARGVQEIERAIVEEVMSGEIAESKAGLERDFFERPVLEPCLLESRVWVCGIGGEESFGEAAADDD